MIGHNETSETFSLFPDERITFYLTVFTFSFDSFFSLHYYSIFLLEEKILFPDFFSLFSKGKRPLYELKQNKVWHK